MQEIFGIPMSTLLVVLVVMLTLSLLTVALIAWRLPVIFKLGMRNIPRRRVQSTLIVIGLMLSTLIISSSLGTGDTMNHSISAGVYDVLGEVDEFVVYSQDSEGESSTSLSQKIPASSLGIVEEALAGNPNVEAIGPVLFETVPAMNERAQLAEPVVTIAGIDPATVDDFGGLTNTHGAPVQLAEIPENSVVLSETAAIELGAQIGDELTTYYGNNPLTLTVAGIAPDSVLTGVLNIDSAGMVMPLDRLQQLTGQPDVISLIAISNTGGVRDGIDRTDEVVDALEPALSGTQLGIDPIKQTIVDQSESLSQDFTSIFLIFGLFSIAAGILLIVLIFTMLAAERRPEMGMARAVGAQRRQLIEQFIAEGMGYALVAGLIGSALGVLASVGIAYGIRQIIGDIFEIEPYITPRSIVVAYCLGVVITFIAVAASSWKVSRLNVVAAIRDIPDIHIATRRRSTLVWGALMLIGGALMILSSLNSDSGSMFYMGMSLLPLGLAMILRFFGVPSRPVFTAVGLFILVLWLLPEDTANALFGTYDAGIEMFFLSGIFVVAASTMIIVQNMQSLLSVLTQAGGVFRSKLPAVRTAVAYPGEAKGRTGMTIAMFSLIIFSLVMVATITENFAGIFLGDEANAGWHVRVDAAPSNEIGDFEETLSENGVDTSGFAATGKVTMPNRYATELQMPGADDWKNYTVVGMSESFLTESDLLFQQRAEGYESDEAIAEALRAQPNVAVIDSFAVPTEGNIGGDDSVFMLDGITSEDDTFAPITVEVADPDSQVPATVTIIGIIDSQVSSLNGLYLSQETADAIYPDSGFSAYYVKLQNPEEAGALAKEIESVLLRYGAQAVSIEDELEESQAQSSGMLYIMQGFMALGLIVGVAAVGVIAFRSVVERRQQIGVLRALGYQRSLVALSFVIESGFIVVLGIMAGATTGLVLAYNLMHSESFGGSESIDFVVPWNLVGLMVGATIAIALLMAWLPARQASQIAPAEALRYE